MTQTDRASGPAGWGLARGVFFAVAANFCFATSDMLAKLLTTRYPVFQVIVMQTTFACIPFAIMLWRAGGLGLLRPKNPVRVFLRGFLAGIGTIAGFTAYSMLPLANVYSIMFCVPIVVTIASIPILGEYVGPRRMAAVAIGFLGILVMVRPGFEQLSLGHLAAFFCVFTGTGTVLIIRSIGREEQPSVMVGAVLLSLMVVSLPGLWFLGRPPALEDIGLAAAAGFVMGAAQFLSVESFRSAPIAAVAPMQYTMLIWAVVYGFLVFGDGIQVHVLAGAAIVIASSLYIMHRERYRAREEAERKGRVRPGSATRS